jgi:fructose-1,6-bisphosphatase/inositol monophosphatase family enzyme
MNDLLKLLDVATEAIALARNVALSQPPGTIVAKGDRDMTSETDLAIEDTVRRFLSARTPEIGFLGEEQGMSGGGPRRSSGFWIRSTARRTSSTVSRSTPSLSASSRAARPWSAS